MVLPAPDISLHIIVPQIILLISAIILLLLPLFWKRAGVGLWACVALTGFVVALYALFNLWQHPSAGFGGMVMNDRFALAVQIILIIAGIMTVLVSINEVEKTYLPYGEFFALLQFAVLGMMIMVSSTNLLVIFLGLEVFSITLYVLVGIRKMRVDSVEGALKYFLLGAFATGFFLYGAALLYGATGSIDLLQVGRMAGGGSLLIVTGFALIVIGLGFKAAFVPFHMWTPDAYQGAPTPVAAFMSTGTKAAAIAVLCRVVLMALPMQSLHWQVILQVIAVLTMTVGNLMALVQNNIKRMLAYSSIAHAGYLLVALIAVDSTPVAAILFYLLVYMFMNIGAFAVLSFMGKSDREERLNFESYRGLGYRHPFTALAVSVFMFSLAGIPPTGGFIGKFYLFSAAVHSGYITLVIIAVMNAVISVYYYLRLVVNLYMREAEGEITAPKPHWALLTALIIALFGVLWLGVWPEFIYTWLQRAVMM